MKRLLDETSDLNLVAFGDLSSGLILNWSAKAACPREVLDLLGEKAAACFALFRPLSFPPGTDKAVFGASVIHFNEQRTRIFARQATTTDEVICAVAEPGAPLEPLLQSAIALANQMERPE